MNVRTRLKKLEDKADTGWKVILPTAYRADGTWIGEHGYHSDEVAYLSYPGEPPLRIDRDEEEDIQDFEIRAEQIAREAIGAGFFLRWQALFL